MKKSVLIIVLPALLWAGASFSALPRENRGSAGELQGTAGELQAIERTVTYYLEGGKTGRVELLQKAFHETAEIACLQDGKLVSWNLPTFLGFFNPEHPSDHVYRILSVDFAGDAAAVKAEWDYGTWKYIDYLSLLKVGGEWKIVHKIFYRTQPE